MCDASADIQMVKQSFTTRIDPAIRALAERVAAAERRSLTGTIEVAILEYAAKQGFHPDKKITDE